MAPDRQLPFIVGWVERFLRLSRKRPSGVWRDALQIFLECLAKERPPIGRSDRLPCGGFVLRPIPTARYQADIEAGSITVRSGKRDNDRVTLLPALPSLRIHYPP
jgi:hypothetical protein